MGQAADQALTQGAEGLGEVIGPGSPADWQSLLDQALTLFRQSIEAAPEGPETPDEDPAVPQGEACKSTGSL